jgi:hypothetical protein
MLRDRGFYSIEGVSGTPLSPRLSPLVAVNTPASESDPARVVPEQLAAAVAPAGTASASLAGSAESPGDQERGQRLWWFILAAVILLLAAETLVAQRARGTR